MVLRACAHSVPVVRSGWMTDRHSRWKKIGTKHDNLVKMGVDNRQAWEYANTRKSYWQTANSPILATTLTNEYLENQGYESLINRLSEYQSGRSAVYRTVRTVLWEDGG